ncbi:MAG: L-threonate dehydrogenase [Yoonia sp.]|uniref:L-threonate dehydrogenase n=1 Tax=Yoonia sp. TaxID=2212373 RepID=UPI003EF6B9B3
MTTQKIAIIGLGSMGYGMASSLLGAGHQTHGFDINPAQVARFQGQGGAVGELPDIASQIDALVVVVLNAAQTESVLFGDDGVVGRMKAGSVVLACATVPPAFARDMAARCAQTGVHYLDAPISGGAAKAAQGRLSIMASGTDEAFAAARPALDAMAEKVFELGNQAGAGSAMKAVNQMLAGVHIAAMAEALTFGMTQGVSPEKFVEVIPECAGTSWMLENRAPHIVAGDYTPLSSVNIWPKDLGIVLDIAREAGFAAPVTQAALAQFQEAAAQGLGGEDDAAVAKVYAGQVGVRLPDKS